MLVTIVAFGGRDRHRDVKMRPVSVTFTVTFASLHAGQVASQQQWLARSRALHDSPVAAEDSHRSTTPPPKPRRAEARASMS